MGNPLKSRVYKFFGGGVARIPKNLKKVGDKMAKGASAPARKKMQWVKKEPKIAKTKKEFGNYTIIYIYIYIYYLLATLCELLRSVTLFIIPVCNSLRLICASFFHRKI